MPLNVNNPEADALTRKFAGMLGVGITDAINIAMKEAIARRRAAETPLETAARLRAATGRRTIRLCDHPLSNRSLRVLADCSLENATYRGPCIAPLGASPNGIGVITVAFSENTSLYLPLSP